MKGLAAALDDAPPVVVALEEVRVVYGGRSVVDIDRLAVRQGELLVVIGPNGAGKSTLLRVLGLLETPTSGRVSFRGHLVASRDRLPVRRQMASAFQDPLLIDATVFDNVALGLRFRGLPRRVIGPRVEQWMERLGIGHLSARAARTLSGGEAQRTALARALVLQPAVLFLDEPFAALDQPTREALIVELGRILRHDRITTVMVTHDRGEAMALGDRVAAMMDGRILQLDAAARLFRAPASEAVARFVGVETIVDGRIVAAGDHRVIVEVAGEKIEVDAEEGQPGGEVRVCVRPEDVALGAPGQAPPSASSNQLAGRIVRLVPAGAHVRVVVDCGFPLVALVTPRALEEMAMREGLAVTATFPVAAAHLIARA